MQWCHPDMLGDVPPPCRAHTATLTDRRIVVFGGGEGPVYYNDVYVLDTVTRRWSRPVFPEDAPVPPPRRAHTAVLYQSKIWVFGGGNGMGGAQRCVDAGRERADGARCAWEAGRNAGEAACCPRLSHGESGRERDGGRRRAVMGGSVSRMCGAWTLVRV